MKFLKGSNIIEGYCNSCLGPITQLDIDQKLVVGNVHLGCSTEHMNLLQKHEKPMVDFLMKLAIAKKETGRTSVSIMATLIPEIVEKHKISEEDFRMALKTYESIILNQNRDKEKKDNDT